MKRISQQELDRLAKDHMRYESADDIALFKQLVCAGQTPFVAAINATGRTPGVVGTDTQFRQDNHARLEGIPEIVRRELLKRPGYSGNAVFHAGLGEWVESVSDIKRAAARKNKTVEDPDTGKTLHQGHYTPQPRPPIREDIVRKRMVQYAAQDPSLVATPAKARKLREDVINKHTPHWRKKDTVIE